MTGPTTTWRIRRERLGLSLRELAKRSGINRGSISRIERGWPATAEQAAAIVAVLDAAEKEGTA